MSEAGSDSRNEENFDDPQSEGNQNHDNDSQNENNSENDEYENSPKNNTEETSLSSSKNLNGVLRGINQIMINNSNLFDEEEQKEEEKEENDKDEEHESEGSDSTKDKKDTENDDSENEENDQTSSQKGELEQIVSEKNNLLANESENENSSNHSNKDDTDDESDSNYKPVSQPDSSSKYSNPNNSNSKNPRRKYQLADTLFNDVPFSPSPLDPSIQHFVYKDDHPAPLVSPRSRNRAIYRPDTSAPQTARIRKSPYFLEPFTIYKVNPVKDVNRDSLSFRSGRALDTTSKSSRANQFQARVPEFPRPRLPTSDYLERTEEHEKREKDVQTARVENYKATHKMPFYEQQYRPKVLDIKVAKFRQENLEYRRAMEAKKRRESRNRREHRDLLQRMQDYEARSRYSP
ncbi:hypothetical protein TRFO_38580 [Tritrichomonas foetus]|uniref:Uncharacterized protein n=1 Tax=Tritrichomonas foetus TaxID=1144522 RepID=A0A1J4J853_9EUKA|nr:hypothetical protein TRFO_38580 [Tritrichomonas foetus]|eukprot:OHS95312.1 hypothetical protein TRFO_38580 [Tritrichomonas foetus]